MRSHNALYNLGTVLYTLAAFALLSVLLAHATLLHISTTGTIYLTMLAISLTFQGTVATTLSSLGYGVAKRKSHA